MKRKLERMNLDGEIVKRLASANVLTVEDLLQKTVVELVQQNFLHEPAAQDLMRAVCSAAAPSYQTVALLDRTMFLATGIEPLDIHLCGGLPSRSITEIVGPSGAGKTQFCLMMTVTATLPEDLGGRGGKVIYIDTEGAFNAGRLQEIASSRFPSYYNTDERLEHLLASVITKPIQSSAELNSLLDDLEALIITENVRFLVLDSIASKIRNEFDRYFFKKTCVF